MRAGFIKDKVPMLYFGLFSLIWGISVPFLSDKLENPLSALFVFIFQL